MRLTADIVPEMGEQPFEAVEGRGDVGLLFLGDPASNALPPRYGSLALSAKATGEVVARRAERLMLQAQAKFAQSQKTHN
jgi:predicted N-formylglutamate amidohydrolase